MQRARLAVDVAQRLKEVRQVCRPRRVIAQGQAYAKTMQACAHECVLALVEILSIDNSRA
eukprot:6194252-Pleurochrysis_carterae.AAC.3